MSVFRCWDIGRDETVYTNSAYGSLADFDARKERQ